jgi:multisubunit Na+/H+ antiporter MnhB subunit
MNGMSDITKSITRIITGPILLFSVYLMVSAARSHGAGFAGGVIAVLAVLLWIIVFGRDTFIRQLREKPFADIAASLSLLGLTGLFCFLLFAGKIRGVTGTTVQRILSFIPLASNILLCLFAAAALLIIFLSLVSYRMPKEGDN